MKEAKARAACSFFLKCKNFFTARHFFFTPSAGWFLLIF